MSEHCLPNRLRELRQRARELEQLDDVQDATVLDPEPGQWQIDVLLEDGVCCVREKLLQAIWMNEFEICSMQQQGDRKQVLLNC